MDRETELQLIDDLLAIKSAGSFYLDEAEKSEHRAHNHTIMRKTLDEDFVLNESMQATMASGANDHLTFGRFEGALDAYNRVVEAFVSGSPHSARAA